MFLPAVGNNVVLTRVPRTDESSKMHGNRLELN